MRWRIATELVRWWVFRSDRVYRGALMAIVGDTNTFEMERFDEVGVPGLPPEATSLAKTGEA